MNAQQLKKSVPFVSSSFYDSSKKVCLVDKVEIPLHALAEHHSIAKRLEYGLRLKKDVLVPASEAIKLCEQQLDVALELPYSGQYWKSLREGEKIAFSYLLETCHYLDAAPYRMAKGINRNLLNNALMDHVATHVIEEADHRIYFENALLHCGIDKAVLNLAKPTPTTLEWIYLMRAVSSLDPLAASICSGFLEHTAKNKESVGGWHKMLIEKNVLSEAVVNAIFEHIEVDMSLGHGANWKKALEIEEFIDPKRLVQALNAVTLVGEILDRWSYSLLNGISNDVVKIMPHLSAPEGTNPDSNIGTCFTRSLPVLSAELYHAAVHGGIQKLAAKEVIGVATIYGNALRTEDQTSSYTQGIINNANGIIKRTAAKQIFNGSTEDLFEEIKSWLCVIDGHRLWKEMLSHGQYSLICGWLLENYHYISAIAQHNGSAIAACNDGVIRAHLVHHLTEELNHGEILGEALRNTRYGDVTNFRPLPTTVAFVGALTDLAQHNWPAYCLAMVFLQSTMENKQYAEKHDSFYAKINDLCPEARALTDAMKRHDSIDIGLEHENDMLQLLDQLNERNLVNKRTLASASIIPPLFWSFFDGIRCHYQNGDGSVIARTGWVIT